MSTNEVLEVGSLTARAIAAYEKASAERRAEQERREAESREQTVKIMTSKLFKLLGAADVDRAEVSADGKSAQIEGLTFVLFESSYSYELHLQKPCPDCGGLRTSYEIKDLDDMGMFLANDHSGPYHECRPPRAPTAEQQLLEGIVPDEPPQPTDAERTLELLRELLALARPRLADEGA